MELALEAPFAERFLAFWGRGFLGDGVFGGVLAVWVGDCKPYRAQRRGSPPGAQKNHQLLIERDPRCPFFFLLFLMVYRPPSAGSSREYRGKQTKRHSFSLLVVSRLYE